MKGVATRISLMVFLYALFAGGQGTAVHGQDAPPATQPAAPGGPDGGGEGGGGGGGQGRHNRPPAGFHLIPRFALEKLNLTDDQNKQVQALEAETKTKLAAILTPAQMTILMSARPPFPGGRRNGGGQGGKRGPPPDGQNSQGGGGPGDNNPPPGGQNGQGGPPGGGSTGGPGGTPPN